MKTELEKFVDAWRPIMERKGVYVYMSISSDWVLFELGAMRFVINEIGNGYSGCMFDYQRYFDVSAEAPTLDKLLWALRYKYNTKVFG